MYELSLNILDIAQNSVSAGAGFIEILIRESGESNLIEIVINDDGCGMDENFLKTAADPFVTSRKSRKVGLGLPLLKMAAEAAGGGFDIESKLGEGTKVHASFQLDHIDRAPLGDIESTMMSLLIANPDIDFMYEHSVDGKSYRMDTREFRKVLGKSIRLDTPEVTEFISSYLKENEKVIYGGAN